MDSLTSSPAPDQSHPAAKHDGAKPRHLRTSLRVTEPQLLDRTIGEDAVLSTSLAEGLWPVLADVGQLEQVAVNLAVNARDAMSDGGTPTIDTANVTAGANSVAAGAPVTPGGTCGCASPTRAPAWSRTFAAAPHRCRELRAGHRRGGTAT